MPTRPSNLADSLSRFENDPVAFVAVNSLRVGPASLLPFLIPQWGIGFSSALLISCPLLGWSILGPKGALFGLALPGTMLLAEIFGRDRHKLVMNASSVDFHYGSNIFKCPWRVFDLDRFSEAGSEEGYLDLPIVRSELNSIERYKREQLVAFGSTCDSIAFRVDGQAASIRVKLVFELDADVCRSLISNAAKVCRLGK